jgi:hypothetical protein
LSILSPARKKQRFHAIFPSRRHLARRAAARSLREDTWENEGGHLAAAKPAASSHASAEGRVRKAKAP